MSSGLVREKSEPGPPRSVSLFRFSLLSFSFVVRILAFRLWLSAGE